MIDPRVEEIVDLLLEKTGNRSIRWEVRGQGETSLKFEHDGLTYILLNSNSRMSLRFITNGRVIFDYTEPISTAKGDQKLEQLWVKAHRSAIGFDESIDKALDFLKNAGPQ